MSTGQIYTIVAIVVGAMTIAMPLLKLSFKAGEIITLMEELIRRIDKIEEREIHGAVRNTPGRGGLSRYQQGYRGD